MYLNFIKILWRGLLFRERWEEKVFQEDGLRIWRAVLLKQVRNEQEALRVSYYIATFPIFVEMNLLFSQPPRPRGADLPVPLEVPVQVQRMREGMPGW